MTQFKHPNSEFEKQTKPVFCQLQALNEEFRSADLTQLSGESVINMLHEIEQLEKDVLIAWATSTRDINPNFHDDVLSGRHTYHPADQAYLNRMFGMEVH